MNFSFTRKMEEIWVCSDARVFLNCNSLAVLLPRRGLWLRWGLAWVSVPEPLSPLSLGCDAGWGEWSVAAPGTKLQTAGFGRSDGLGTPAAWLLSGSLRYRRKELQKVGGRRGTRFAVVYVGGSEVSLKVHGSGFALMQ